MIINKNLAMKDKYFFFWILAAALFLSCSIDQNKIKVTELRCRNLINPEGIDEAAFSWKTEAEVFNFVQTAYEIEIASSDNKLKKGEADVWKSGKQISDRQIGRASCRERV